MPQMLALDIATVTGWAVAPIETFVPATDLERKAMGGVPQPMSGSQRMGTRDTDEGVLLGHYEQWLDDMISLHNPDVVVWEAAFMGGHFNAAQRLLKMHGITDAVCSRRGIKKAFTVNMGSARKYFCGRGRADTKTIKRLIQQACDLRRWTYTDDNESDALCVWEFACACLTGVIAPKGKKK